MKRIESIIEYIDQNYHKKISLQEVADNEYLSVYHTSHFIKNILGISFQEYLNSKRLDKFIELLMSTDETITQISYESGFPSTKFLNRLFKLEYNCSPTEYKRIHKTKDEKFKNDNYLDINKEKSYKQLENYLEELNKKIEEFNKNNL